MRTVDDVRTLMDHWFPPQLAESWDAPGLVCGDPADEVHRVATALEATDEVVAAAIDSGAQMLLVHHPLLMRGVTTVSATPRRGGWCIDSFVPVWRSWRPTPMPMPPSAG